MHDPPPRRSSMVRRWSRVPVVAGPLSLSTATVDLLEGVSACANHDLRYRSSVAGDQVGNLGDRRPDVWRAGGVSPLSYGDVTQTQRAHAPPLAKITPPLAF